MVTVQLRPGKPSRVPLFSLSLSRVVGRMGVCTSRLERGPLGGGRESKPRTVLRMGGQSSGALTLRGFSIPSTKWKFVHTHTHTHIQKRDECAHAVDQADIHVCMHCVCLTFIVVCLEVDRATRKADAET